MELEHEEIEYKRKGLRRKLKEYVYRDQFKKVFEIDCYETWKEGMEKAETCLERWDMKIIDGRTAEIALQFKDPL